MPAQKKSAPKASPNLQFAVEQLKKNPKIEFGAVKAAAEKKGLKMIPIIFGRAKLALGIAKKGPAKAKAAGKRGPGRPPKSASQIAAKPGPKVKVAAPGRRGPGRPPKSANAGLDGQLAELAAAVRESEAQRRALDQIRAILDGLA